jgi:hypothetical protein
LFLAFVGWTAALSAAFALTLGSAGINGFINATVMVQADPIHQFDTMAFVFGIGPVTYGVEAVLGALALVIAYLRRAELEMVFALGVLGSVMASPHMHEPDYALDVLAAWLVVRAGPGPSAAAAPVANRLARHPWPPSPGSAISGADVRFGYAAPQAKQEWLSADGKAAEE